jgi:hypothetical protein
VSKYGHFEEENASSGSSATNCQRRLCPILPR